jgi:hypothetical protein
MGDQVLILKRGRPMDFVADAQAALSESFLTTPHRRRADMAADTSRDPK